MPRKVWNGKGMLSQGVEVRFASRVGQIRRPAKPHPWPPPAADLKKEEEAEAALAQQENDPEEG